MDRHRLSIPTKANTNPFKRARPPVHPTLVVCRWIYMGWRLKKNGPKQSHYFTLNKHNQRGRHWTYLGDRNLDNPSARSGLWQLNLIHRVLSQRRCNCRLISYRLVLLLKA